MWLSYGWKWVHRGICTDCPSSCIWGKCNITAGRCASPLWRRSKKTGGGVTFLKRQVSWKDAVRWSKRTISHDRTRSRSITSKRRVWSVNVIESTWQRDALIVPPFLWSARRRTRSGEVFPSGEVDPHRGPHDDLLLWHHLKHLRNASQWYLNRRGNRITADTFSGAAHERMKWFHPNDFINKSRNRRLEKKKKKTPTYLLVLLVSARPNLIKYFVQSIFLLAFIMNLNKLEIL